MNELIIKISFSIKRQMIQWRGTFNYIEIETFVGCTLMDLRLSEIITPKEEEYLRRYLIGK